ncbi:class I SAM-dependent methyltransferase [Amycolatopsis cihanbeyliensis]|nr:methyltransferase [Amycolatopsis cihanbeyliensis]
MSAHTHDDLDWAAELPRMHRLDALEKDSLRTVADRLVADLPPEPTVVDVGSGSGGMSAALAGALAAGPGGTIVLLDAVDELLDAARTAAAGAGRGITVDTVVADAGTAGVRDLVPPADLIWASAVVHHLPDQQAAIDRLVAALRGGGRLALAEGGLDQRLLPWDLGVGKPGLEGRLQAAREGWFLELRTSMPDAVRMPYGWSTALGKAGLVDVTSFTYLVDHPAPATGPVLDYALERLSWLAETTDDRIDQEDRDALGLLLDPRTPEYLGNRTDVFLKYARTVHYGRLP